MDGIREADEATDTTESDVQIKFRMLSLFSRLLGFGFDYFNLGDSIGKMNVTLNGQQMHVSCEYKPTQSIDFVTTESINIPDGFEVADN